MAVDMIAVIRYLTGRVGIVSIYSTVNVVQCEEGAPRRVAGAPGIAACRSMTSYDY